MVNCTNPRALMIIDTPFHVVKFKINLSIILKDIIVLGESSGNHSSLILAVKYCKNFLEVNKPHLQGNVIGKQIMPHHRCQQPLLSRLIYAYSFSPTYSSLALVKAPSHLNPLVCQKNNTCKQKKSMSMHAPAACSVTLNGSQKDVSDSRAGTHCRAGPQNGTTKKQDKMRAQSLV